MFRRPCHAPGGSGHHVLRRARAPAAIGLLMLLAGGCDYRVSDDYTPHANENSYGIANSDYPEYELVCYYVKGYDAAREQEYMANSLSQAAATFEPVRRDGRMGQRRYLLIMVRDIDPQALAASFASSFKAARVFAFEDVFANMDNLDTLIRRTPAEPPPLENGDKDLYLRSGPAAPIITRHIQKRESQGQHPTIRDGEEGR